MLTKSLFSRFLKFRKVRTKGMFLALTVSSIAHEIYYLDNRYLVRYSFSYILHFPKTTATAKKGNLRTPIKF